MPAQWQDNRRRNAAMQLAMFLVFVAMIGLAAWIGQIRWRQQSVALDGSAALRGVRISLPSKWERHQQTYSDAEVLTSAEPPSPKSPERGSREIVVIVFPAQDGPRVVLDQWLRQQYHRQQTNATVEYYSVDGVLPNPSAFARVMVQQALPNGVVREMRAGFACVRVGEWAVVLKLADSARRPQTDEQLLRDLARSVRLPESEV